MNGNLVTIDSQSKTCTCNSFLDKAICEHLVAACMLDKVELNGLQFQKDTLRTVRTRRRKVRLDESLEEDNNLNEQIINENPETEVSPLELPQSAQATSQTQAQSTRGPGRPPKVSKA